MLNNFQTPPQIQIPELDIAQLIISFNAPPPLERVSDDIDQISAITDDFQPMNLLNEFNQVADHLGAPSPIGPDVNAVFECLRLTYNALLLGILDGSGYTESSRYVMNSLVRDIMNAPLGIGKFVVPKQDDYEPAFSELTDKIHTGTDNNSVDALLILKNVFYQSFQGVLNWINTDDIALTHEAIGYVTEYVSIIG
jgi:hypothetical protein